VSDRDNVARLQTILTQLLERQLSKSLSEVHAALGQWHAGQLGAFEAHTAVLTYAARAEKLAARISRVGLDGAGALLRDAHDLGLLGRDEFLALVGCPPEEVAPSPPLDDDTPPGADLPEKRALIEQLLEEGPVLVHVDARRSDVDVPPQFRGDAKLVLRFGYDLTPAIIDLGMDEHTLSGTLTFGGVPHRCVLPWPALYAVVSEIDQRGMVWPEDVPQQVAEQLTGGARSDAERPAAQAIDVQKPGAAGAVTRKAGAPHLKLVK
jgi:stringent starvation protein B